MNDFNSYQEWVKKFMIYPRTSGNLYPIVGLAGEVGEVCEHVKKYVRDGTLDVAKLTLELGDVLWYLTAVSAEFGIELQDIMAANVRKIEDRASRGVLGGSGDER